MSDLELQSIRDFILCAAARFPRGITTFSLNVAVIAAGFELPARGADALEAQLKYLRGKNLLALKAKAHTASAELHELTPDGDDYLRSKKLLNE